MYAIVKYMLYNIKMDFIENVRVRPDQSGLYLAFNEPLMDFNGGAAPTGRGVSGHLRCKGTTFFEIRK